MRISIFPILAALTLSISHAGEWVELFNGKNLDGWTQKGGVAEYTVEDGTIVGTTVPDTPNSFLCTEKDYGDFLLEVEFKVDPEMNSGIQFRSNSKPDYKDGQVHGYQMEIDPSRRGWSGGIYDEGRRGWLDDHQDNRAARYAFKQNEWNTYRLEAIGDKIRTWVNGVPAANLSDEMTAKGFIALQVHGIGKRTDEMTVRWRNIRIQENPEPTPEVMEAKPHHDGPLVAEDAEFRQLGEGYTFTEGPALGPDGRIYFNDIPNERTHVYDPESGKIDIFRESTGRANGLFWAPGDHLISCEGGNRVVTEKNGDDYKVIAEKFDGKKFNSPNDCVLDGIGGIYFSDPRYGKDGDDRELDIEAVYYIDKGGKITQVAADLVKPNGLILSPDNKTLYIADPGAEKTYAYDVEGPGKLANKREFAAVGSDGMTVDIHGNIFVTWKGEVIAFSPDGKELMRIAPPEAPANCLLVRRTLYVTARKGFYAVDLLVDGL